MTLKGVPKATWTIEPPREEWFIAGTDAEVLRLPEASRRSALIVSPPDGATIALDPDIPPELQLIVLAAELPEQARLVLDGMALAGRTHKWRPLTGNHVLSVVDGDGRVRDSINFRVRVSSSRPGP